MTGFQYVQYGCGMSAPKGWRNFDASPTLLFERLPLIGRFHTKNETRFPKNVEYGDIVKGLPVPFGASKCVYCSHILEHLSLSDFRIALRNTKNILQPGGIFRLVLPDLEYSVRNYINDTSNRSAHEFMKSTSLGHVKRARNLMGFLTYWFGNSQHLWMWDYKSIHSELENIGFMKIRRAFFGDSTDPVYRQVEDRERWENCLGVECRNPW